ncbi:MAG: electron transfer flavoprotein subunit beta/FixA family protein [bacterium]
MNIVVCVKQTPVSDNIQVDPKTGCLIREGAEAGINPFDEFAIEEAVRLKERLPGSVVCALTMGPPRAEEVLREAIARGCDSAVHLCDSALGGSDTWATSYSLSMTVKKISAMSPVGLVLCGKQTNDSDTGHIGPGMAAWLDWPGTAFVRKVREITATSITVERLMEDGMDIIEMPLPAVISVVKEINEPRIASLRGRLAAKKTVIPRWTAAEIGCDPMKIGGSGSPTSVVRCFTPEKRSDGMRIEGASAAEKVSRLLDILKERKLI